MAESDDRPVFLDDKSGRRVELNPKAERARAERERGKGLRAASDRPAIARTDEDS